MGNMFKTLEDMAVLDAMVEILQRIEKEKADGQQTDNSKHDFQQAQRPAECI